MIHLRSSFVITALAAIVATSLPGRASAQIEDREAAVNDTTGSTGTRSTIRSSERSEPKATPKSKTPRRARPTPAPVPQQTPTPDRTDRVFSPDTDETPQPAPTPAPPPEVTSRPLPPPEPPPAESSTDSLPSWRLRTRTPITVSYTLSPLGLAVPLKHGPAISWNIDPSWTLELSYFAGSLGFSTPFIDIGAFRETLITASARYFFSNSFNLILGLSQQSYDAKIGDSLVSTLSGGSLPGDVDVVQVTTLGLQAGFGNRWQWENGFALGVDWLVLNFPFSTQKSDATFLRYVSDQNARRQVEDVITVMRYIPTGAITKVSLGYSF